MGTLKPVSFQGEIIVKAVVIAMWASTMSSNLEDSHLAIIKSNEGASVFAFSAATLPSILTSTLPHPQVPSILHQKYISTVLFTKFYKY